MKKAFLLVCSLLANVLVFAQQEDVIISRNPTVITGQLVKTTIPLRDFEYPEGYNPRIVRDLRGIIGKEEGMEERPNNRRYRDRQNLLVDPALQSSYPNFVSPNLARAIGVNFNGIGTQNLNPPDPSLCVGPNHVIQMINGGSGALFKVFSKTGGQLKAQTYLNAITGKGGLGDPVCLYDQAADRFILTEFADKAQTGTEGLIFAVSKTNDPTGSWSVYYFSTGTTFPDYPKYSVWNNAYYATTNDFSNGSSYSGSTVYAFDRAAMIAGSASASMQKFTLGSTDKYFSMSPVKWEGTTAPPTGTGGLIAYMQDNTWTGGTTDSVGLLEFKVNFNTPSSSVVVQRASLAVAANTVSLCTSGNCIPQPGTSTKLDDLEGRVMNQPIYRNFGSYEGIVLTYVVNKGSAIAAPRWYELRKTSTNWSLYQQSTYSPDNVHRWMPAICYDAAGNIGLIYNVSDATSVYPGIRYTGRKQCDSLNTMSYAENVIVAGTGSLGSGSGGRYGDYNHLVCDTDGVTFWMTAEWNSGSSWTTRIASFTLDNCNSCGSPSGLTTTSITSNSATISWAAVTGATSYDVDYQVSGAASWTNATTATASLSVNLSNLSISTSYNWRVRANCSAGSSAYTQASFTSAAACGTPGTLSSSSITTTGATVSWAAVASAINYDVDYQVSGTATWTNAATATTSTSVSLSGLNAGSNYLWRVRANCSAGAGNYAQANFITLVVCGTVTGLTTSSITSSSATLSWSALTGANNYTVEYYKDSAVIVWITAAAATTSTTVSISGLSASKLYYWRVRGNCTSGAGTYGTSSFTTTAPSVACVSAYETNETVSAAKSISNNTTVSAGIGTSIDIDYYKITTSGTTNLRILLSNMPADYDLYLYNSTGGTELGRSVYSGTSDSILYNNAAQGTYIIKVVGYNGAFNASACYNLFAGVTTTPTMACPSTYDVSSNGAYTGAATIPSNTDIKGTISSTTDVDFYKFTVSVAGTIKITLSTLPADYDLELYGSNGTTLLTYSRNSSTTTETINYTASVGTYYIRVYGYAGAFKTGSCYTLRESLGTARLPEFGTNNQNSFADIFPNPAHQLLNINIKAKVKTIISIYDMTGKEIIRKEPAMAANVIDVRNLASGIYLVKLSDDAGNILKESKFIKD